MSVYDIVRKAIRNKEIIVATYDGFVREMCPTPILTIARISTEPLTGARTIDARGLVVAPAFIDLHEHGQSEDASSPYGPGRGHRSLKLGTSLTADIGLEPSRPPSCAIMSPRRAAHLDR